LVLTVIVLTATVVHNLYNNGIEYNFKMFCNRYKKNNNNTYRIQLNYIKTDVGKKPYAARHHMNNVVIKLDSNDLLLNHKTISYLSK